jgi:hypothetical protein
MSALKSGLVRFPPGTTTRSLGRNGTFITTGIYVDSFNHIITLTPQNSRRDMARCAIELPNDARVLLGLILEILKANPGTREALHQDLAAPTESSSLRH